MKKVNDSLYSPKMIGEFWAEKILLQEAELSAEKIEYLISILYASNLKILKSILQIIFSSILNNQDDAKRQKLGMCLEKIAFEFQDEPIFRVEVVDFFENYENFPINIMMIIPTIASVIYTSIACEISKFSLIAKKFLINKLVPNIFKENLIGKFKENILEELALLGAKQVIEYNDKKLNEMRNLIQKNDICIRELNYIDFYNAILETDSLVLANLTQLRKLFDFFNDFSEIHAAAFIVGISSSKCNFRNYFEKLENSQKERIIEMILIAFSERKIEIKGVISSLDQPVFTPSLDECSFIFSLFTMLIRKDTIPFKTFLKTWKNKLAQLNYLIYLSVHPISQLNYQNCKMAYLPDFESQKIPNNCWMCLDFVNSILNLSEDYRTKITEILANATDEFAPTILISYSQLPKQNSKLFEESAISLLSNIIQKNLTKIFQFLWEINDKFVIWLFTKYYYRYPNKRSIIIELISNHIDNVINSDDKDFIIQIVFQASMKGTILIENVLKRLIDIQSNSIIENLLIYIKELVLQSDISSSSMSFIINKIFAFIWSIYNTLPQDLHLKIYIIYTIIESYLPNLNHFDFAYSNKPTTEKEIKEIGADIFSRYLDGSLMLSNIVLLFHQHRIDSPKLFQVMERYLLLEMKYINKHNQVNSKKLGELIGSLAHENLFNEKQIKYIFTKIVEYFQTGQNIKFGVSILTICYSKLLMFPNIIISLLKQPSLKNTPIYDKINKLSVNPTYSIQCDNASTIKINIRISSKFEKLKNPPPRVCKAFQTIPDKELFNSYITTYSSYINWIAFHFVTTVQDHPKMLPKLIKFIKGNNKFTKLIMEAAIYESIELIISPQFSTFEGGFARRRLSILGSLLGKITFAQNKTIPLIYLDLKQLLLHGFSYGKLFGIIPFIGSILCSATKFFFPPNPYISSLLQVLASISMINLLKSYIRNQISKIFVYFGANPYQINLLSLVPKVKQNNFDFTAPPFSLNYILSLSDISRLIQYDETIYQNIISQYLTIPKPSSPSKEGLIEKMKTTISNMIFQFLKSECSPLAKIAASTAFELISKDFIHTNNTEIIQEATVAFVKQLSSGLALYKCYQKNQNLLKSIQSEFNVDDSEWCSLVYQKNYAWFSQLFTDIINYKALRYANQKLEEYNERKKNDLHTHYNEKESLEHFRVYQEIKKLHISPAEVTLSLFPTEKTIKINKEFEKFNSTICRIISNEIQQGSAIVKLNSSASEVFLANCPNLDSTFEEFLSAIRSMLKYMSRQTHKFNDTIYTEFLHQILSRFPPDFPVKAQPYVIQMLRNSIPSIPLLCTILNLSLISTSGLDKFFFDALNCEPFNYKLFIFTIGFLYKTIIEKKMIHPSEMISSLTLVAYTPLSLLETPNLQCEEYHSQLCRILDEMDVPLTVLSLESKLQTMSTFDPIEEISHVNEINSLIEKWKENTNIKNLANETLSYGKDLFTVLFYTKSIKEIKLFFNSFCQYFNSSWTFISSSIINLIMGNSMVIKYDMTKYFEIIMIILSYVLKNEEFITDYAYLLHKLRPIINPSFTFSWIQLISENHFVHILLSKKDYWVILSFLISDFIVSTINASDSNPSSQYFEIIYKGLLRFILIILHDFPDFIVYNTGIFLSLIPNNFTQIRNILLSSIPTNIKEYTLSQLNSKPTSIKLEKISIDTINDSISDIINLFKQKNSYNEISSFLIYISSKYIGNIKNNENLESVSKSDVYQIITILIEKLDFETNLILLNVLIDQLRFQYNTTLFFHRILLKLYESNIRLANIGLDELLLRLILERIVPKGYHPWGLLQLLNSIIKNKNKVLFECSFIKQNKKIQKIIESAETVLNCRKDLYNL